MDEYYTYYVLDHNDYGWIINYCDTDNGYLDTIDSCSFKSIEKVLDICHTYDITFEQDHLDLLHKFGYFLDIKTIRDLQILL